MLTVDPLGIMFSDKDQIATVTFLDNTHSVPRNAWVMGKSGAPVWGWVEWDQSKAHVYFAADGGIEYGDATRWTNVVRFEKGHSSVFGITASGRVLSEDTSYETGTNIALEVYYEKSEVYYEKSNCLDPCVCILCAASGV